MKLKKAVHAPNPHVTRYIKGHTSPFSGVTYPGSTETVRMPSPYNAPSPNGKTPIVRPSTGFMARGTGTGSTSPMKFPKSVVGIPSGPYKQTVRHFRASQSPQQYRAVVEHENAHAVDRKGPNYRTRSHAKRFFDALKQDQQLNERRYRAAGKLPDSYSKSQRGILYNTAPHEMFAEMQRRKSTPNVKSLGIDNFNKLRSLLPRSSAVMAGIVRRVRKADMNDLDLADALLQVRGEQELNKFDESKHPRASDGRFTTGGSMLQGAWGQAGTGRGREARIRSNVGSMQAWAKKKDTEFADVVPESGGRRGFKSFSFKPQMHSGFKDEMSFHEFAGKVGAVLRAGKPKIMESAEKKGLIPPGTDQADLRMAFNHARHIALHEAGLGEYKYALNDEAKQRLKPLERFMWHVRRSIMQDANHGLRARFKGQWKQFKDEFGYEFADKRKDIRTGETRRRFYPHMNMLMADRGGDLRKNLLSAMGGAVSRMGGAASRAVHGSYLFGPGSSASAYAARGLGMGLKAAGRVAGGALGMPKRVAGLVASSAERFGPRVGRALSSTATISGARGNYRSMLRTARSGMPAGMDSAAQRNYTRSRMPMMAKPRAYFNALPTGRKLDFAAGAVGAGLGAGYLYNRSRQQ